jgi:hypothetical protein
MPVTSFQECPDFDSPSPPAGTAASTRPIGSVHLLLHLRPAPVPIPAGGVSYDHRAESRVPLHISAKRNVKNKFRYPSNLSVQLVLIFRPDLHRPTAPAVGREKYIAGEYQFAVAKGYGRPLATLLLEPVSKRQLCDSITRVVPNRGK